MIFVSHFISMTILAVIIATMLAFIKFDEKKDILRYGVKILVYIVCGVIIGSWMMYFM